MSRVKKRLLAGAPGGLVPVKRARRPKLQQSLCHCGCGRGNFFIQPRSPRFGSIDPLRTNILQTE